MNKLGVVVVSSLAVGVGLGCQKDTQIHEELADINKRLESIEKSIKAGGGAGRAQRPQRKRPPSPNPKDVFAVNIAGAPYLGEKDARVTIIKAENFA